LVRVRRDIPDSRLGGLPVFEVLKLRVSTERKPTILVAGQSLSFPTHHPAPFPVHLGQLDSEEPQIGNLLPLEPIQIRLQRRGSVLEILLRRLQRVLKLSSVSIVSTSLQNSRLFQT
jgi:hypothetical protein